MTGARALSLLGFALLVQGCERQEEPSPDQVAISDSAIEIHCPNGGPSRADGPNGAYVELGCGDDGEAQQYVALFENLHFVPAWAPRYAEGSLEEQLRRWEQYFVPREWSNCSPGGVGIRCDQGYVAIWGMHDVYEDGRVVDESWGFHHPDAMNSHGGAVWSGEPGALNPHLDCSIEWREGTGRP